MPTVQIERPRTLCPAGLYTFTLADVTTVEMDAFNPLDGKVERWVWRFVSNRINPEDGLQYEIPIFTGQAYGNGKAKLTWLLDMLIPGISKAQAANLNTDSLIGKTFDGSVKHAQSQKDPDKKIAEIQYLRPITDTSAPTVAPDPFEFDKAEERDPELGKATCIWKDCHKLLNLQLIESCRKHFGAERYCAEHGKARLAAAKAEAEALAHVEAVEREATHAVVADMIDGPDDPALTRH